MSVLVIQDVDPDEQCCNTRDVDPDELYPGCALDEQCCNVQE